MLATVRVSGPLAVQRIAGGPYLGRVAALPAVSLRKRADRVNSTGRIVRGNGELVPRIAHQGHSRARSFGHVQVAAVEH